MGVYKEIEVFRKSLFSYTQLLLTELQCNLTLTLLTEKNAPKQSPKASQAIEKQPQEILEDPVDIFVDFKRLVSGLPQISRLQKLKNELAEAIKTTNKITRKRNGKNLPRLITPQHKLLRAKDKIEPKIKFVKSSTKNKWSKKKQVSKAPKKPIDLGKDNKTDSKRPSTNNITPKNDIVSQYNGIIKPENNSASVYTNTEKNEFFCTPEEQPFIQDLESEPFTFDTSSQEENGPIQEELEQTEILDNSECSFNDSSTYIDSSEVSSSCYDSSTETILDTEEPIAIKAAFNAHEGLEDPIDIFVDFQKLLLESPKTSRSQKTKNDLLNVHPSRQKNIKVKSKKLPKLITPQHKLLRAKYRPEPKIMSLKSLIKIRGLKKSACTVQESPVSLGLKEKSTPLESSSLEWDHVENPESDSSFSEEDSFGDFSSSLESLFAISLANEQTKHPDKPEIEKEPISLCWDSMFSLPCVADALCPDSAADLDFEQEEFWDQDLYEEYEEEFDFLYTYKRKHN